MGSLPMPARGEVTTLLIGAGESGEGEVTATAGEYGEGEVTVTAARVGDIYNCVKRQKSKFQV